MGDMASAATAAPPAPPPPQQPLAPLASLDLSSRADSTNSTLSQGSVSGNSEAPPGQPQQAQPQPPAAAAPGGAAADQPRSASGELASAPSSHSSADGDRPGAAGGGSGSAGAPLALPAVPPKKEDARSSALKALAGVSAIVSKSRKVDAEALQAIKSQRAKARAEGHPPGAPGLASAGSVPMPSTGRVTPPPGAAAQEGPGISPFASATSQGLVRSPSGSNLSLGGLAPSTSLPLTMHSRSTRRSPAGTPPASAADYDAMVSGMTITELVALKQAVEGQLAKQAMALAQLHAGGGGAAAKPAAAAAAPPHDMLSSQYAALLLQNAQQAQLVQQLSSQQQAAHAVAIQQALSAAAAAAGITSPTFSPEQLLLGAQHGGAPGLPQYASMPLQDPSAAMASPFASASYPPEAGFGLEGGPRTSLPPGVLSSGGGSKASGSPRSASAEQQLIGEALHSFVDPERQGPPSRQGSALVNGINWSDRRASGALGPSAAFARSRSMPHPAGDVLGGYGDCGPPGLPGYLPGEGSEHLPSLFNGLAIVQEGAPAGGMAVPLPRGGHGGIPPGPAAHMSPTAHTVSFADSVQTRTYQAGYQ